MKLLQRCRPPAAVERRRRHLADLIAGADRDMTAALVDVAAARTELAIAVDGLHRVLDQERPDAT